MKRTLLLFILGLSITGPAFSHSGNTDSKGGHHDRKRGGYHYHHGFGPHDHPGGVCELSTATPQKVVSQPQYSYPQKEENNNWSTYLIVGALGIGIGYLFRGGDSGK